MTKDKPLDVGSQAYQLAMRQLDCQPHDIKVRRKVLQNGSVHWWQQCAVCGQKFGEVRSRSLTPAFKAKAKDFDEAHRDRFRECLGALIKEYRPIDQARRRAAYEAYLLSPEWFATRAKALGLAGHTCEVCKNATATQVHHLTYERLGAELMEDLVAVCRACHESLHARGKA